MRLALRGLIVLCASIGLAIFPAKAEKRIALIVGNNAYENVPKLQRAVSDATAIAQSLRALGFDVLLAADADRREFVRQLAEFGARVQKETLALFYYAGHGIEVRGANYLLPIDVPAVREGQEALLTGEAIPTDKIIADLQDRGARAMVLILDACRDNPFKRSDTRSVGGLRGLALTAPPEGVFVLYSAGVGQSALDRMSNADTDPNSVFTRVLLKELAQHGASMIDIAKATQAKVRALALDVGHTQVPAYYDQIVGQLHLADGVRTTAAPAAVPADRKDMPPPAPPQPPLQTSPVRGGHLASKGLEEYLARDTRNGSGALTMPDAIGACDRLASAGPGDDPDARAPRVPADKIDVARAKKACVAAILQNRDLPRARWQLARTLLASAAQRDKLDGLSILADLAEDGHAVAMWRIGIAYWWGKPLKENRPRALYWWRKAAEKGLGAAMSDLGAVLTEGEGVAKNLVEAAHWLERAAAVGHAAGMRNYAFILDRGTGVQADPVRSADYLLTAYRMGSGAAARSLFDLHESWTPETRKQVQHLLREFGFYDGPISGRFDRDTFAALRALAATNPVQGKN